jgi:hypothetical protein
MHRSTIELAERLRRRPSQPAKLDLLRGSFAGQTCVVVTCGPSLQTFDPAQLRSALDGKLTIAVKQAIDVVGDQADFHTWNSYNVSRFAWPSRSTIKCLVKEPTGRVVQWNRPDLSLTQEWGNGDLSRSLAHTRQFDAYGLELNQVLPFGPGIMYELVFYLALHLGVSEIVTVGWDIANDDGKNTHFYDSSSDKEYFERGRVEGTSAPSARESVPEPMRRVVRMSRTFRSHRSGQLYNRTTPLDGETRLVSESTADVAAWLRSKGVRLRAVTESPHVLPPIERLSPADFLSI